jgi:hypothetical protein
MYFLTEWFRICCLTGAAFTVIAWQVHLDDGAPVTDVGLRVTIAALSAAATTVKSVRDKWKMLERSMQQLSFAGALLLSFGQILTPNVNPSKSPFEQKDLFGLWYAVAEELSQEPHVAFGAGEEDVL